MSYSRCNLKQILGHCKIVQYKIVQFSGIKLQCETKAEISKSGGNMDQELDHLTMYSLSNITFQLYLYIYSIYSYNL